MRSREAEIARLIGDKSPQAIALIARAKVMRSAKDISSAWLTEARDAHGQWTGLERAAVKQYKEGGSQEINGALRSGAPVPFKHQGTIHQIDNAIAKGHTGEPTILWRAMTTAPRVGGETNDPAFMSTA